MNQIWLYRPNTDDQETELVIAELEKRKIDYRSVYCDVCDHNKHPVFEVAGNIFYGYTNIMIYFFGLLDTRATFRENA
ncbi:MAG: hypothetical protein Q8Q46_03360 [Candidatus Giovannonibacteria bacterium]|nr:hypothetical protein [Candidatus Giovannonibacteria bacterium]